MDELTKFLKDSKSCYDADKLLDLIKDTWMVEMQIILLCKAG
jgi:hypothetical protein